MGHEDSAIALCIDVYAHIHFRRRLNKNSATWCQYTSGDRDLNSGEGRGYGDGDGKVLQWLDLPALMGIRLTSRPT